MSEGLFRKATIDKVSSPEQLDLMMRVTAPVGWLALAAVILQGVLGGLTVLFRLPAAISVGHAALAQLFFCLTVSIAVFTSRRWRSPDARRAGGVPGPALPGRQWPALRLAVSRRVARDGSTGVIDVAAPIAHAAPAGRSSHGVCR